VYKQAILTKSVELLQI